MWWSDFTCIYLSHPSIYFSFVRCSILPISFYFLIYVLPYSVLWYFVCAYFILYNVSNDENKDVQSIDRINNSMIRLEFLCRYLLRALFVPVGRLSALKLSIKTFHFWIRIRLLPNFCQNMQDVKCGTLPSEPVNSSPHPHPRDKMAKPFRRRNFHTHFH